MAEKNKKPAQSEELSALMEDAAQRVEDRRGKRSASEVVNTDNTRQPYSVRLTAREVHRLRMLAIAEGEGATELARRLILEGLAALEARHVAGEKNNVIEMVQHLSATRAIIDALIYAETSKLSELVEAVNALPPATKPKAKKA